MTRRVTGKGPGARKGAPGEAGAVYAIHIAGEVGPMLVSSLCEAGSATGSWDVHVRRGSTVLVSVTDADLVEVVRTLAANGIEVGSVRELGAGEVGPSV